MNSVCLFCLVTISTIFCQMFFSNVLLFGGIQTLITINSNCLKYNMISIMYLLILLTTSICFSHCSSIRIPTPDPFFLSSAAFVQYPIQFLLAVYIRNLSSLSVMFVSVIFNIVIFSSSAQLSRFSSFYLLVLSLLIL